MAHTLHLRRRGFTLVELLVVIGIIAVMIGILLPVLSKARKSARTTVCLSNLRQMGNAWVMYMNDTKGRLPHSVWTNYDPSWPPTRQDEFVWSQSWFGILGTYRVASGQNLCPEAQEPTPANWASVYGGILGGGSVFHAWSGIHQSAKVPIHLDKSHINLTTNHLKKGYRIGSYGFNGNVFFSPGPDFSYGTKDDGLRTRAPADPGDSSRAHFGANIGHVKPTTEVPVFYDAVWIENVNQVNGTPTGSPGPPAPPPDLTGSKAPAGTGNNHWRFMLARHGRGICMAFADGHAKWVSLEDTYQQKWTPYWRKYSLNNLPRK